jgi:hypothetical protein
VVYFSGLVVDEGNVMVSGKVQIEVTTGLGRRKTDNMPSLARVLEILAPREEAPVPGMDASVSNSVRITGKRVCDPVAGEGNGWCDACGGVIIFGQTHVCRPKQSE